ncbi:transporter substrate-binding domain-containing protein [Butyrivibrio sp. JL13D10]|uniref:transporter substrate-binding domain-containing protein n=1 Tax=Butyrivibrio sp. JL13D10 TaxID=3236815 RepID=UPI0038B48CFF
MKKNNLFTRGIVLLGASLLLTGCGAKAAGTQEDVVIDENKEDIALTGEPEDANKDAQGESTNGDDQSASSSDVIKIVAATTGTGPKPYVYSDENNNVTGYDIELLKYVFSKLPQYELEITQTGTIFEGLDAGYYDIAVNHFGFNKERGEKYLFSDVYSADTHGILVKEDSDINSLEDLPGHTTEAQVGSNNAIIFEAYNEAHPDNPVNLNYTESSDTEIRVANGDIDFEFFTKKYLEEKVEELGLQGLRIVDISVEDKDNWTNTVTGSFLIFPKDKQQLVDDVNGALEEAIADGTVDKLIGEFLGKSDIAITQAFVEQQRAKIAEITGQ